MEALHGQEERATGHGSHRRREEVQAVACVEDDGEEEEEVQRLNVRQQ